MVEPRQEPDPVALDPRLRLASERTLLAWIRTGLAMMGFGFVVARFGLFLRELSAAEKKIPADSTGLSLWLGTALVVSGVLVNLIAVLDYRAFISRYRRGEPDHIPNWSLGISTAMLLICIGICMVVYLLTLG